MRLRLCHGIGNSNLVVATITVLANNKLPVIAEHQHTAKPQLTRELDVALP